MSAAPFGADTDETGYLRTVEDRVAPLSTTLGERMYFQRGVLEAALWSYGEEALLDAVRHGRARSQVESIGDAAARLLLTPDPTSSSGAGHAADRALALATVEVIEGAPRALVRTRRRRGTVNT